jgi:hypothetical protein
MEVSRQLVATDGNGLGLFLPFAGSEAAFFCALFADDLLRTRSMGGRPSPPTVSVLPQP